MRRGGARRARAEESLFVAPLSAEMVLPFIPLMAALQWARRRPRMLAAFLAAKERMNAALGLPLGEARDLRATPPAAAVVRPRDTAAALNPFVWCRQVALRHPMSPFDPEEDDFCLMVHHLTSELGWRATPRRARARSCNRRRPPRRRRHAIGRALRRAVQGGGAAYRRVPVGRAHVRVPAGRQAARALRRRRSNPPQAHSCARARHTLCAAPVRLRARPGPTPLSSSARARCAVYNSGTYAASLSGPCFAGAPCCC